MNRVPIDPPFIQSGTGAVPRTVQIKGRERVTPEDFGAVGDGVTDDTAAINAALASLSSGGELRFLPKTYLVRRGDGVTGTDNIISDNITITGDGARIVSQKSDGTIPNDAGNETLNVFQATSRTGITIKGLMFSGYCAPCSFYSCTNVLIDGCSDNGLLSNAGAYLRSYSLYLFKCVSVRVRSNALKNVSRSVFLGGDGTTRSRGITISGNNIWHETTAGAFTAQFPAGVYINYADNVIISGNTFRSIYSSVDTGTNGTGVGYAVFEVNGGCNQFTLNGNTLQYDALGNKRAYGIYTNLAEAANITGNVFYVASAAHVIDCVLIDSKITNTTRNVSGNTFNISETTTRAVSVTGSSTSNVSAVTVSGNTVRGGSQAFRQDNLPGAVVTVSNNTFSTQSGAAIQFAGSAGYPLKRMQIVGNRVEKSGTYAVFFNGYCVSPQITGNMIIDGNTTNQASDSGSAILFASLSHGSFIANNIIGNTPDGGGLFTRGVQNASNAVDRILKDIAFGNTFFGLVNNNQFGRYWTSSPTNGIFDINKGDFVANAQLNASGSPGWYCVQVLTPTLSADASSASTTVTMSSTSSVSAGDIILLTKTSNPLVTGYYTTAEWHVDTVASVTNSTQLVLTSGIPAGDGTYVAGTAAIRIVRFKAAPAIAA